MHQVRTLVSISQKLMKPCRLLNWHAPVTMNDTAALRQVLRSRKPLKVVAARVGGVEIPNNKHVEFSVRYIYGIGPTTARAVVAETVI